MPLSPKQLTVFPARLSTGSVQAGFLSVLSARNPEAIMSKAKPAPAPVVETIKSVHIVNCISHSISTDGKTAMLVFMVADKVAGEKKFGVTISLEQLPWLRGVINGVMLMEAGKLEKVLFQLPEDDEVNIGIPAESLDTTTFTFDKGNINRMIYLVSNLTAMKVAEIIKRSVPQRMTEKQRADFKAWTPPPVPALPPSTRH
jgi:hypothetical protein